MSQTMSVPEWKKFQTYHSLFPGDRIVLHADVRTRGCGNEAIVVEKRRTRYLCNFGGQQFLVSPQHIAEFWRDPDGLEALSKQQTDTPRTSAEKCHQECKAGDVVLFFIGKYDVCRVVEMGTRIRAKSLANGKTYLYNPDTYVCKLPAECFPAATT